MNFQQIRDSLGQKDGDYQAKTEITATIKRVKDVEFSKKGKKGQSLYIEIDSGEQDWVKFIGKGVEDSPLDDNSLGRRAIFLVWPFRPEQASKTYLYCWIQREVPQGSSQAPPQAAQQPNPAQGAVTDAQILAFAERFLKAVETLVYPNANTKRPTQPSGPNPEYVGDNPPPVDEEDDVPF